MDRRTFLSRSAIGAGALALGAGCGAVRARESEDPAELAARLHRGLARVRGVPHGAIARVLPTHPQPRVAERVLRLGLEALVVLDVTRSLPAADPIARPLAMQLEPELPLLDRYVTTYHSILVEMPRSARRRLDAKVRERPGATMDIAGWIDGHARDLGVATESRLLLRRHASEVDVRMRRQSAGATVDDCAGKIGRLLERSGSSVARARAGAASALMAALWQQAELPGPSLATPGAAAVAPELVRLEEDRVWSEATAPERSLWSARWARPGDEELEVGGVMMPLGVVTCGLLLIVGLIVTLVGVSQNASWDGLPRAAL